MAILGNCVKFHRIEREINLCRLRALRTSVVKKSSRVHECRLTYVVSISSLSAVRESGEG